MSNVKVIIIFLKFGLIKSYCYVKWVNYENHMLIKTK